MFSLSHLSASWGVRPQLVGQVESTSTMLKPLPAICASKALRMAFLAATTWGTSCTETRSM